MALSGILGYSSSSEDESDSEEPKDSEANTHNKPATNEVLNESPKYNIGDSLEDPQRASVIATAARILGSVHTPADTEAGLPTDIETQLDDKQSENLHDETQNNPETEDITETYDIDDGNNSNDVTADIDDTIEEKVIPSIISKREQKRLKKAILKNITTMTSEEPTTTDQKEGEGSSSGGEGEPSEGNIRTEYTQEYYMYHYNQYQQYLQQSKQTGDYSEEVAKQYCDWLAHLYSKMYAQNVEKVMSDAPPQSQDMLPQTHFRQKTFEELQAQDQELKNFFEPNIYDWTMRRAAFKQTFRGTRSYQLRNKTYNPSHFNIKDSKELRKKRRLIEKQFIKDKEAYVSEYSLDDIKEPKSNKQLKREAWREQMKAKIRKTTQ
eukprot:TRINITY_DN3281_c0_g1_i1.p1 TRINITY_DN3281_c0_g1~~TRINITY_DN3281_c0_g1_i1.p1  ORF type:complete len:380 (-),score=62.26 TRINITY_DN3281_c0_g1_i1:421-1560(-)